MPRPRILPLLIRLLLSTRSLYALALGLASLWAVCALVGCATSATNLTGVSTELEARTGHGLTQRAPGDHSLPPGVSIDDGLSEDEAVLLALWNNALFQETLADLGLSRADLVQAGMLPNPTFSMLIPVGAKPLELTAKYPFEILWLRPKRVAAAKLDHERTAQRLVQSGLDLIREVRIAFAEVTLAEQRLALAGESVTLSRRIAELAKARLQAGDASELEAGSAGVDALQAQEQFARLGRDVRIARERLRHLVGLGPELTDARLVQSALPKPAEQNIDLLVTNALAFRPDLLSAQLNLEAAGQRLGLARREIFSLAAGINSKEIGSGRSQELLSGPTLDFPIPILNQNQGGIAQAKAKFEKAARQYGTIRDRIVLEVRESHARLAQAQESHQQWQGQILPSLESALRRSQNAYQLGDVSYLFVLETTRKLYDARLKEATAAAELYRARAELERGVGHRLDTVPPPQSQPPERR